MVKPVCLAICAWALTCSALALTLSPEDESAQQTALQWLRVLDSGDYKEAAGLMSQDVRPTKDWLSYLNSQRAGLRHLKKRQLLEAKHTPTIPAVANIRDYMMLSFKSAFDGKADAREEIVLGKTACCWEIFDYKIEN